jgi:hypothetical protein
MKHIWAAGFIAVFAATPMLAQSVSVERTGNGYIVHTRQTFADGTKGVGEERVGSVPEILRDFVAAVNNPSQTRPSMDNLVVAHRQLFPRATVDSLLAGYETLATDPTQNPRVAITAIGAIGMLGSSQHAHPVPGQTQRLLRIYGAGDKARRYSVLSQLGNATERPAAVAFLRGIATLPSNAESEQLVVASIRSLALLGNEGAAALREMDRTGAVRNPEGRVALRAFAGRGYRARP